MVSVRTLTRQVLPSLFPHWKPLNRYSTVSAARLPAVHDVCWRQSRHTWGSILSPSRRETEQTGSATRALPRTRRCTPRCSRSDRPRRASRSPIPGRGMSASQPGGAPAASSRCSPGPRPRRSAGPGSRCDMTGSLRRGPNSWPARTMPWSSDPARCRPRRSAAWWRWTSCWAASGADAVESRWMEPEPKPGRTGGRLFVRRQVCSIVM